MQKYSSTIIKHLYLLLSSSVQQRTIHSKWTCMMLFLSCYFAASTNWLIVEFYSSIAFLVRHLRRSRSTRWSINQCHASNYNARCNSMMKKSTFSKTMLYHRRHHHCLASWHLVVIMLINAKFYSMPCHSRNANASTSYVATTQCKNQLTRAVRCWCWEAVSFELNNIITIDGVVTNTDAAIMHVIQCDNKTHHSNHFSCRKQHRNKIINIDVRRLVKRCNNKELFVVVVANGQQTAGRGAIQSEDKTFRSKDTFYVTITHSLSTIMMMQQSTTIPTVLAD